MKVMQYLKIEFIFFLSLSLNLPVNSQIVLDTVQQKMVGPGMVYSKYIAHSVPWSIDVFVADMTNQYFAIETVKAFELLAGGREKTSTMSIRRNSAGHWSVGAINGDFFDLTTGMPNNIQVENGEVLRNERADWPTVGFNLDNKVSISKPYLTGKLILQDSILTMSGINVGRDENNLILYNQFYGSSTNTSNAGFEATVDPITSWFANDTVHCIVGSVNPSGKNSGIPKGSMVISANGMPAIYLNNHLTTGDTVKIILNIIPSVHKLKEMMGGHPIIVEDGFTASMNPNDAFVYNRHPRTAVGVNEDTTKLFLVTVDGRQTSSLGMNLYELAELMLQLGAYQAINLDGGGSTTMVVRNEIMNSPSDASGERPVSNALIVFSKAPLDSLSFIDLSPRFSKIFIGNQIQFSVSGTDRYFNPVSVNPSLIKYQLSDSSLGAITASGLFTANLIPGECTVTASYGEIKDSAEIIIKGVQRLELIPKEIVTDKNRIVAFKAKIFDTENAEQIILPQSINWYCTDTLIGKIDLVGQFKGEIPGEAKIIAAYMGKSDTAVVRVEVGYGYIIIDSIETLSNWALTTDNVDSSLTQISFTPSPVSIGSSAIKLDYSFTYQTSEFNWAILNTNNKIFGVPDSIMIDILSDGALHRIFFDVVDNENKQFRISTNKLANNSSFFEAIRGKIVSASNVYFPLTLKKISIVLGSTQVSGQTYSGTIYLDNLRVKYPQAATSINDEISNLASFVLYQNYPNPFNPTTKIRFFIPNEMRDLKDFSSQAPQIENSMVTLKVYDILGREIFTLMNEERPAGNYEVEFDGSNLSSGVYFYQLKAGDFLETKKLVLLR